MSLPSDLDEYSGMIFAEVIGRKIYYEGIHAALALYYIAINHGKLELANTYLKRVQNMQATLANTPHHGRG